MNSPYAEDWANLSRYQKEKAKLEMPKPSQPRIVFMGDSITEGWINKRPDFFSDNAYVNRGISGQTTPQMLVRFRADVIDLEASAVVILAGTNDVAGNTGPSSLEMILDNIKSMTEIAKANGLKVILCSVLPAFDYSWRPGLEPNIKIPKLNAMIKDYAENNQVYYLDYFSALDDGNNGMLPALTTDGVHLTLEGYKVMEPMVEKAINSVLK